MKLSFRIYTLFAVSSLAIIFIIVGSFYYFTRNLLLNEKYSGYIKLAESLSAGIDEFLYRKLISAKSIATMSIVSESLSGTAAPERLSSISVHLSDSKEVDPDILEIYIINKNKNIAVSTDKYPAFKDVSGLPEQENILKKVFSGEAAYSDVFISANTGSPTMIFAAPVFSYDGRDILGAVELYMEWSSVLQILENSKATFLHLINKNGLEIGSNEPEHYEDILQENYSGKDTLKNIYGTENNGTGAQAFIAEDLHGGFQSIMISAYLRGHSDYKGNGWVLIVEEPIDSVLRIINQHTFNITVVGFLALSIFSGVLLFFLKKYVIDPISDISLFSLRVSGGEEGARLPDFGKYEIGILARSFNEMMDKFEELKGGLELKIREKTSQLEKELESRDYQEKILENNKSATLNLLEDISAEKSRVDALVAELNKYQLAVENAYEHIIISDPDGFVIYANKAAERITGYTGEKSSAVSLLFGESRCPRNFMSRCGKQSRQTKKFS